VWEKPAPSAWNKTKKTSTHLSRGEEKLGMNMLRGGEMGWKKRIRENEFGGDQKSLTEV